MSKGNSNGRPCGFVSQLSSIISGSVNDSSRKNWGMSSRVSAAQIELNENWTMYVSSGGICVVSGYVPKQNGVMLQSNFEIPIHTKWDTFKDFASFNQCTKQYYQSRSFSLFERLETNKFLNESEMKWQTECTLSKSIKCVRDLKTINALCAVQRNTSEIYSHI